MSEPEPASAPRPEKAESERNEGLFLSGPQDRTSELLRVFRISREFIRGFRMLHFVGPCVSVFGSTQFPEDHPYYGLARQMGQLLAKAGFTVMTGGGPGIMEAANRGAKDAGGRSVGCNIDLPREQHPNAYLDYWITFQHFYVRKVMLAKYSYAFVGMPGGLGTMDEIFEVATLIQTGKVKDFPIVLMPTEYWGPLRDFMRDTLVVQGTISDADFSMFRLMDSPEEAAEYIRETSLSSFGLTYGAPPKRRWFFFE